MSERFVRGLAFFTRCADGRAMFVGAAGHDVDIMLNICSRDATAHGGSLDPEAWMAWSLDRPATPALLAEIKDRIATGKGGGSHPACINLILDPQHPKIRARGDA